MSPLNFSFHAHGKAVHDAVKTVIANNVTQLINSSLYFFFLTSSLFQPALQLPLILTLSLSHGQVRTRDIGGTSSTSEFTDAVIKQSVALLSAPSA
jgi:isocitrate/isopropylmalate dehydrogenase